MLHTVDITCESVVRCVPAICEPVDVIVSDLDGCIGNLILEAAVQVRQRNSYAGADARYTTQRRSAQPAVKIFVPWLRAHLETV